MDIDNGLQAAIAFFLFFIVLALITIFICVFRQCLRRYRQALEQLMANNSEGNHGGLIVEEIQRLETVKYTRQSSGSSNSEYECCICMSPVEENEQVRYLPQCKHCFHKHCIDRWLSLNNVCPLCYGEVLIEERNSVVTDQGDCSITVN
ncbi:hypothetical protein SUGI_0021760 [Cryptomeria japonica]|nr:hypothetical protein SUGI_0021760 [Cryptomeria japonica]